MSFSPLVHGGALRQAALDFDIPLAQWLDLSTGINPRGWPVPTLPAHCWQRLPEEGDGLEAAAQAYYGCEHLLPVAGSQAAIQSLPWLRRHSRVGLLQPAYAEHAAAWQRAGHALLALERNGIDTALDGVDVLLLINPNNPTGEGFTREQLLSWQRRLARRGGWLVVDEAFADADDSQSLAADGGTPGLVVLRSLGKFFGLAGARVGFVLAWPELLMRLREVLGPWAVCGPGREVARLALEDQRWQLQARKELAEASARLARLLVEHHLPPSGATALFQYCPTERADVIHEAMARQGILLRRFDAPAALRFGLPGNEGEWERLERGLVGVREWGIGNRE